MGHSLVVAGSARVKFPPLTAGSGVMVTVWIDTGAVDGAAHARQNSRAIRVELQNSSEGY